MQRRPHCAVPRGYCPPCTRRPTDCTRGELPPSEPVLLRSGGPCTLGCVWRYRCYSVLVPCAWYRPSMMTQGHLCEVRGPRCEKRSHGCTAVSFRMVYSKTNTHTRSHSISYSPERMASAERLSWDAGHVVTIGRFGHLTHVTQAHSTGSAVCARRGASCAGPAEA
jgi:hypothetical protein